MTDNKSKSQNYGNITPNEWIILAGLMAFAFIIRLFMLRYEYVLSPDGVYYAILGKNLISGNLKEGLSTYWPPLYPLLVGVSSLVFHDIEFGGRFISVLAGSLLIIPVYLLFRRSYGKEVAFLGAFLTTLYPSLIQYSTKLLTESVYTLLFMTGILTGWFALSEGKRYAFFLTGLAFGACYLIRPEAIGYMGLMIILTTIVSSILNKLTFKRILLNNLILISGFVLLALPYIFYLYQDTGRWMISEKFGTHFPTMSSYSWFHLYENEDNTMADRIWAGNHSAVDAPDGGMKLNPAPNWRPNIPLMMLGSIKGLKYHYEVVIPKTLPALFILLSAVGLFRTRWSRERAGMEAYLLLFFISTIIGYSIVWPDPRYLVPQLPVLICWAAKGVVEIGDWFAETAEHLTDQRHFFMRNRKLIRFMLIAVVLLSLMPGITYPIRGNMLDQPVEQKQAASWIKEHGKSKPLIMSTGPWAAFYSGGRHIYLPDNEYPVILEYARRKKVDYIVIDERLTPETRPRLRFLLDEEGRPGDLELVYKYDEIPDCKILVFKLAGP